MRLRKVAQLCCVLMVTAACLVGQTVSSSITGTVLDPASAVVPNATVTLTDENTGSVRNVVSDNGGAGIHVDLAYRLKFDSYYDPGAIELEVADVLPSN